MKKAITYLSAAAWLLLLLSSCGNNSNSSSTTDSTGKNTTTTESTPAKKGIAQSDWGETDGKKVQLFTLTNANGAQVKISNYGGTITSWATKDKSGNQSSIVLGFDKLQGYLDKPPYFGATVGRYGNRIANAQFKLNGNTYKLAANDGKNHLHGGLKGFDKQVWEVTPATDGTPSLTLTRTSVDGEEGYPGNLKVTVKFTLSDEDELTLDYSAQTDKATPVNLTNHSYFNLSGDVSNTILNETLYVDADRYTPVDTTLIPTGQLKSVKGTPFDFTKPTKIGARIDSVKGGYDHNFVLNRKGTSLQLVAYVTDSASGRKLEVYTTEPGLQFYTGNFLNGSIKTSGGKAINQHAALCLETQHFPNSPNTSSFPTTTLQPGATYHTQTKYKVSLLK